MALSIALLQEVLEEHFRSSAAFCPQSCLRGSFDFRVDFLESRGWLQGVFDYQQVPAPISFVFLGFEKRLESLFLYRRCMDRSESLNPNDSPILYF